MAFFFFGLECYNSCFEVGFLLNLGLSLGGGWYTFLMLHKAGIHKEATDALQPAGLPGCRVEGCNEYLLSFLWAGQLDSA